MLIPTWVPKSIGAVACTVLGIVACSGSSSGGTGGSSSGLDGSTADGMGSGSTGSMGGAGGATGSGSGGIGGQQTVQGVAGYIADLCGASGSVCSNGKDDDGDGLVDGFDPECTGPCDNDEGSFATGIPGDNIDPKWQDCFFDGDSGAGNDGCRYSTSCLTGDLPQTDPDCQVSAQCIKFCKPFTPNGCDCFGCCTIGTSSGDVNVQIGTSCSLDKLGDATACPPCTKSTLCSNDCGTCELCPGKTEADLPASCKPATPDGGSVSSPDGAPPPPSYTCDGGEPVCSATIACPDPANTYCQLGCCMPIIR